MGPGVICFFKCVAAPRAAVFFFLKTDFHCPALHIIFGWTEIGPKRVLRELYSLAKLLCVIFLLVVYANMIKLYFRLYYNFVYTFVSPCKQFSKITICHRLVHVGRYSNLIPHHFDSQTDHRDFYETENKITIYLQSVQHECVCF